MADYICTGRTNYFKVRNEEAWSAWLERLSDVEDLTYTDANGEVWHGFGCYGTPWYDDSESADDEYPDGDFSCGTSLAAIQAFLADGHAMIYQEAGWEKLRYIGGWAFIVTKDAYRNIDLRDVALDAARDLLGAEDYSPRMDY